MGKQSLTKLFVPFAICLALLAHVGVAHAQENTGTAVISDSGTSGHGTSDNIVVSISSLALPPDGTGYTVQLSSGDKSNAFTLGTLTVNKEGQANGSFQTNEDLIANYAHLAIFFGPPNVKILEGALPNSLIEPARHLLVVAPSNDPLQIGYAKGTIALVELAAASASNASAAGRSNYFDELKGHAEHVVNIIEGSTFDHDKDGVATNPSPGGSLLSYASNITLSGQDMGAIGNDVADLGAQITNWVTIAKDNAQKAIEEDTITLAKVYIRNAQTALENAGIASIEVIRTTQSTLQYSIKPVKTGSLPSVGGLHAPMLPLAGVASGLALCVTGSFLLRRPSIRYIR